MKRKKKKKGGALAQGKTYVQDLPEMHRLIYEACYSVAKFLRTRLDDATVLSSSDFHQQFSFKYRGRELAKDYCPIVFRRIRQLFRIREKSYLRSVLNKKYHDLGKNLGKSGAILFQTNDRKYFLKTVSKAEKTFIVSFLPSYVHHVVTYPGTFLLPILGLFRVRKRLRGGLSSDLYFIVTRNVLPISKPVGQIYDLKGSTIGRKFNPAKQKEGQIVILKDLDLERTFTFLTSRLRKAILDQLAKDSIFLRQLGVMDYSLLLGIVRKARVSSEATPVPAAVVKQEEEGEVSKPSTATAPAPAGTSAIPPPVAVAVTVTPPTIEDGPSVSGQEGGAGDGELDESVECNKSSINLRSEGMRRRLRTSFLHYVKDKDQSIPVRFLRPPPAAKPGKESSPSEGAGAGSDSLAQVQVPKGVRRRNASPTARRPPPLLASTGPVVVVPAIPHKKTRPPLPSRVFRRNIKIRESKKAPPPSKPAQVLSRPPVRQPRPVVVPVQVQVQPVKKPLASSSSSSSATLPRVRVRPAASASAEDEAGDVSPVRSSRLVTPSMRPGVAFSVPVRARIRVLPVPGGGGGTPAPAVVIPPPPTIVPDLPKEDAKSKKVKPTKKVKLKMLGKKGWTAKRLGKPVQSSRSRSKKQDPRMRQVTVLSGIEMKTLKGREAERLRERTVFLKPTTTTTTSLRERELPPPPVVVAPEAALLRPRDRRTQALSPRQRKRAHRRSLSYDLSKVPSAAAAEAGDRSVLRQGKVAEVAEFLQKMHRREAVHGREAVREAWITAKKGPAPDEGSRHDDPLRLEFGGSEEGFQPLRLQGRGQNEGFVLSEPPMDAEDRYLEEIFFGIIDITQQYGIRKKAALAIRGLRHDRSQLSSIEPTEYQARFMRFLSSKFVD